MDGCPSFLSCDSAVTSRSVTETFMFLKTSLTTAAAGGEPPGYEEPFIGWVCPLQFDLVSFHSSPLSTQTRIHQSKRKKKSIQSLPLPQLVVVVVVVRRKRRAYLLVMRWRDALKEHFGNVRIDVSVNPPGPCSEPLSKSNQTIHVFLDCLSLLNVVPSETRARSLIS